MQARPSPSANGTGNGTGTDPLSAFYAEVRLFILVFLSGANPHFNLGHRHPRFYPRI
jgi:hypothetical protein